LKPLSVVSTEKPFHYAPGVNPYFVASKHRLASTYNLALADTVEHLLADVRLPGGLRCDVTLILLPGGFIMRVEPGKCAFSPDALNAVDNALVEKTLPYKGFESVYQRTAHFALCSSKSVCNEPRVTRK
jgi:hypothetical protein